MSEPEPNFAAPADSAAALPNAANSFAAVREILTPLVGREFVNRRSGLRGSLSGQSIGKILSGAAHQKSVSLKSHLCAAANIVPLFERGEILESAPGRQGQLRAVHRIYAPFLFAGGVLVAKVTLKEFTDGTGNRLYSVETLAITKPDGIGSQNIPEGRRTTGPASLADKLWQMVAAVNPNP